MHALYSSQHSCTLTPLQVIRFPLETCSSSANCSSCVTNGDPLCGWCSVESKCSRRSQCRSNNETLRYLTQGNQSNCMNTVTFDPIQFMSEIESVPYQVSCHAHVTRNTLYHCTAALHAGQHIIHSGQSSSHTTRGDIPVCV